MEKIIDLEDLMGDVLIKNNNSFDVMRDWEIREDVKKIVLEVVNLALVLASENADMKCSNYKREWTVKKAVLDEHTDIEIDKQSILDVIKQIK